MNESDIKVGTIVRHSDTKEVGSVVWTWDDAGVLDCYIAFFGLSLPKIGEKPSKIPYMLRYWATGLEAQDENGDWVTIEVTEIDPPKPHEDQFAWSKWRMDHRDQMITPPSAMEELRCPITNRPLCKVCLWDNSGPCFCDYSYG